MLITWTSRKKSSRRPLLKVSKQLVFMANQMFDTECANAQIAVIPALKFNGGGHINHSIFWQNLAPKGKGGDINADLLSAINTSFGSLDNMKNQVSAAAVAVQGSGWGWLAYNPKSKLLEAVSCPNQDPLQSTTGLVPLFGIDVWEHAYYLQYKNARPDYVKAIWQVANWKDVGKRLSDAKSAWISTGS